IVPTNNANDVKGDLPNEAPDQSEDTKLEPNGAPQDPIIFDQQSIADLIKKRVQEEFVSYVSKTNGKQTQLGSSNHHVVNIQPQLNLLEYAQKKLERQMHEDSSRQLPQYVGDVVSSFAQPCTPTRVTDMFQRISREGAELAATNGEWRQGYGSADGQSDGDSVIFDDEEFEKMNRAYFMEKTVEQCRVSQEISHPMKLAEKDMPKLNEKMLNTIGLFTERGDIRPGILDIMEKEKQAKASDSRNKQFRAKRQWDLQFQLSPRNHINTSLTSVSTDRTT
ncbi:hypothetical protein NQ318_009126, partial [Aromia moschata]